MKISLPSSKTRVFTMMLLAAAIFGTACGESDSKGGSGPRMSVSSEDFNNGRTDGRRDAKASWTEDSAAWMWTWMAPEGYRQGYEQGWTEGRAEVKFRKEQERARKDTRQGDSNSESSSNKSGESSGFWGE